MSEKHESNQPLNPTTISGQRMTIVVLLVLGLSGALFYWVTTAYSGYNAARRHTDRIWRDLASQLEPRYRRWDKQIAQAVDAHQLDMRIGERWHSARERFSATTLAYPQIEAAQALEQILVSLPTEARPKAADTSQSSAPQPAAQPASTSPTNSQQSNSLQVGADQSLDYQPFLTAVAAQRAVGQTLGSRMLKLMLNLPDPPTFQPAGF